jgi:hypothetical protein
MISVKEFRELSLEEQFEKMKLDFSDFDLWKNEYLRVKNEDLSNKMKVSKLKELHKLLKNYDYTYFYADDRNSRLRGEKQRAEIVKLKDEIGKEGHEVWIQFLKDKGMMEVKGIIYSPSKISESIRDDLSPSDKASIKKYMKELEKLCKKHNWHWMYEKDDSKFKHGQFMEQKIREIVIEIKELGDISGFEMYQKFAAKNGIKINYFKECNESGIYDYERYYISKLKKYGIKSTDELCPEGKKKFDSEVDNDWHGGEKVKTNIPEQKSMFPEMNTVVREGSLDYAIREVGQKSLTAGSFCDAGNLYENIPKWIPPSKERKRYLK